MNHILNKDFVIYAKKNLVQTIKKTTKSEITAITLEKIGVLLIIY